MIKIRELRAELLQAGCDIEYTHRGREVWKHSQQPGRRVVLDGSKAQKDQIVKVRRFLRGTMIYE